MRVSIIIFFLRLMLGVEARAADPSLLSSKFATIEQQVGGRLGVAALDTGNGRRIEYRADERSPYAVPSNISSRQRSCSKAIGNLLNSKRGWQPIRLSEVQVLLGKLANTRCGTTFVWHAFSCRRRPLEETVMDREHP